MYLQNSILVIIYCCLIEIWGKSIHERSSSGDSPLNLTPYIDKGETDKARNLSAVDPTLFAGVHSHAAFITVNKTRQWNLFFWFFPAENQPLKNTPWIIWLQGGPGASSMFGLFTEIGPIIIKNNKVEKMPITWGSNYSLLFIDNPVQAGFSYSEDGSTPINEDEVGDSLLSLLQQFLEVFPELRKAPLFIAGESYAGKYIPAFGHYIHHNKNESRPINLKGLAIGDGLIDPPTLAHYSDWAPAHGFMDLEEADKLKQVEDAARKYWDQKDLKHYIPTIEAALSPPMNVDSVYNYMDGYLPSPVLSDYVPFLNRQDVRAAIHVGNRPFNDLSPMLGSDIYLSVKPWFEELLEHYGVMCYNGQLDVLIAYGLSMYTYKSFKWSGQDGYLNAEKKPIYGPLPYGGKGNIGFVKSYSNFMDVMVLGAGHMVPTDQPRIAKIIIDMFINKFK